MFENECEVIIRVVRVSKVRFGYSIDDIAEFNLIRGICVVLLDAPVHNPREQQATAAEAM